MKSDLNQLFQKLNLVDDESLQLIPLTGGTQHQCFRVIHANGHQWAVKQLSVENWLGPCEPAVFERGEQLACSVSTKTGLSLAACRFTNGYVQRYNEINYLIYPWLNGIDCHRINQFQAYLLGESLALIHQLPLTSKKSPYLPVLNEKARLDLNLIGLVKRCNQVRTYQSQHFVLSHRDIHLSNVIWLDENKPIIIDWESAGYIHPTIELIGLALNVAGIEQGKIQWGLFDACLSGYKKACLTVLPLDEALYYQLYHTWLSWILFCQKKKLDLTSSVRVINLIQHRQTQIMQRVNA